MKRAGRTFQRLRNKNMDAGNVTLHYPHECTNPPLECKNTTVRISYSKKTNVTKNTIRQFILTGLGCFVRCTFFPSNLQSVSMTTFN